jgi:hypothetical protein
LKPAASRAVNGKPALNGHATAPGRRMFQFGTFRQRVQPAGNTQFEFDLSRSRIWTKWRSRNTLVTHLKTIRFGFDRF